MTKQEQINRIRQQDIQWTLIHDDFARHGRCAYDVLPCGGVMHKPVFRTYEPILAAEFEMFLKATALNSNGVN